MRVNGRWVLTGGVVVLLVAGLILAPVGTLRWGVQAATPIKLGEVGPLSPPGGYADGQLMKDAAILATDQINPKGGVLGRPVRLSYQATRALPDEGPPPADRLPARLH